MSIKSDIYAYLDALCIPYAKITHPPVHAIEDCRWAETQLGGVMPKNLLLTPRNQSAFTLCIICPDALFRTGCISKQLHSSRLSFAPESALAMLHTYPDALSPMGLIFPSASDIRLTIDEQLFHEPRLLFHPNDSAETLAMSGVDFFDRFLPATGHDPVFVDTKIEP